MHSPALAVAWELGWRHRWGLAAMLAYLVAVTTLFQVVGVNHLARSLGYALGAVPIARGDLEAKDLPQFLGELEAKGLGQTLGLLAAGPLVFGLLNLLVMFGYSSSTNLAMRASNFPARMFTLPVRTATLVAWPMAYGTAAMALTVAATVGGVLWPCGVAAPLGLSAALSAALLAWSQAISWSPSRSVWLRAVVAALVLMTPVAAVMFGLLFEVPSPLLAAGLLGSLPVAYAVALVGVARARRGDVPEWPWWLSRWAEAVSRWRPRRRRPFATAARAQVWFEWRRHGLALPFLVGLVLPMLLLGAAFARIDPEISSAALLMTAAALPPVFAPFVGASFGKMNPWVKGYYGVPPFTAVRPMTSGGLVGAKLKMAALSTLTAWALLILGMAAVLLVSGRWGEVTGWARAGFQSHPLLFVARLFFGFGGLLLLTWKNLVESLYVGLTGRGWVITGNSFFWFVLSAALGSFGAWLYYHPAYHETFFAALPWLLGAAVPLKLLVAALMCRAARRRGLVSRGALVRLLSLWLLVAAGLVVLLCWLVPGDAFPVPPLASLVCGVVLFLPLTGLAAAPLALAWNRHR
jgi:hypothetical protein